MVSRAAGCTPSPYTLSSHGLACVGAWFERRCVGGWKMDVRMRWKRLSCLDVCVSSASAFDGRYHTATSGRARGTLYGSVAFGISLFSMIIVSCTDLVFYFSCLLPLHDMSLLVCDFILLTNFPYNLTSRAMLTSHFLAIGSTLIVRFKGLQHQATHPTRFTNSHEAIRHEQYNLET